MSKHERARNERMCERCGQGERECVLASRVTYVRKRDTYARVFGPTHVHTSVRFRGSRWGNMCDACWASKLRELDALADARAQRAYERVSVFVSVFGHEYA